MAITCASVKHRNAVDGVRHSRLDTGNVKEQPVIGSTTRYQDTFVLAEIIRCPSRAVRGLEAFDEGVASERDVVNSEVTPTELRAIALSTLAAML